MYSLTLTFDDEKLDRVLLAEEVQHRDRSTLAIRKGKITITAQDAIALKATVQGVLKVLEAYEKTSSVIS